jgi:hypothetical protein
MGYGYGVILGGGDGQMNCWRGLLDWYDMVGMAGVVWLV